MNGGGVIGGAGHASQWGPGGAQSNSSFQDSNGGFQGQLGGGYGRQPSPGLFDGGFGAGDGGFGLGIGSNQLGGSSAPGQDAGLFGIEDIMANARLGMDEPDTFGGSAGSQLWND